MSDCSNHKKDLFGYSDMREVAKAIGDLHYETMSELLEELHIKIMADAKKDWDNERFQLSQRLTSAESHLEIASMKIRDAWQICKPFMKISK